MADPPVVGRFVPEEDKDRTNEITISCVISMMGVVCVTVISVVHVLLPVVFITRLLSHGRMVATDSFGVGVAFTPLTSTATRAQCTNFLPFRRKTFAFRRFNHSLNLS